MRRHDVLTEQGRAASVRFALDRLRVVIVPVLARVVRSHCGLLLSHSLRRHCVMSAMTLVNGRQAHAFRRSIGSLQR
jgi:hypothetical protein